MTPEPSRFRRWLRRLLWLPVVFVSVTFLQVAPLRFVDPPTSAFMLWRQVDGLGEEGFSLRQEWRDYDEISAYLPISVVAAEDQKFPQHHGFDLEAIDKALASNAEGGRVRGGSTISQQVAKNLYLWSGGGYFRKALEAWYTVLIELTWPKQRILEVYVNIAEFGDGVYGAEAAAQAFFNKPASALTAAECARLAAVLPNPKRYSARSPGPYVQRRAAWIQRNARNLGGPAYLDPTL
ncbi:MAG TPA: monofunctional biosynthetic peptidoglycan transglycosylase [Arenimonas sp.]|uniref:monofunctional biosynthetic peptidoglycan transglycosylase n=1 Tax=Arenimonas sp. TaxID=1872635 RepID=UPI002D7E5E4E|nr:monofunctional biosynthetic peptidoglycan transglycosylase [Arenimonas sp.]HEU0152073.1 monofunctional biosynthetic peptidoglycan transglycosylase [Arenimonas sp.]